MSDYQSKRADEAAKLEAKAKALRRAEKAFWDEVEERLPEIQKRFNLSDKFAIICRTYNASIKEEQANLYKHLLSERQVQYYKKTCSLKSNTDDHTQS